MVLILISAPDIVPPILVIITFEDEWRINANAEPHIVIERLGEINIGYEPQSPASPPSLPELPVRRTM